MRTVAVLALQDVIAFDLGIACDVFSRLRLENGDAPYRVFVCSESREVRAGAFNVQTPLRLDQIDEANLVIVPGIADPFRPISLAVLSAIRSAVERGALVASICTGAFALAAAGVLDGKRATTHWAMAEALAQRFPRIQVDPNVLFVDEGMIVTSAGTSAGLDMCLHLVQRHHGHAVAAKLARFFVAPLHRDGGQAQFIHQFAPVSESTLGPLLDWMLENLNQPIDVSSLAERAHMSPRTFARRFKDQTGTTPIQWLLKFRVRRAQELLETTSASIEHIATASGFESMVTFRARFQRLVGVTPSAYRRQFSPSDLSSE